MLKLILVCLVVFIAISSFLWIKPLNTWLTSHDKSISALASLIAIIGLPAIVIGLYIGFLQLKDMVSSPAVELRFVHPNSVSYEIVNTSNKIAEEVLVSFGIFDIDSDNPRNPIPIPSKKSDYVNVESHKGPFSFFQQFGINGHRYFGIIYIGCKGCQALETYWLYVKHGHPDDGFYAKRIKEDTFQIQGARLINDLDNYLQELVPHERRIYISGRE